jgi:ABC-type polysaccharide/polyol phosphate transport system ATPase subunit
MSDSVCVVQLDHVYKMFPAEGRQRTLYRLAKGRLLTRHGGPGTLAALDDINLKIVKGEKVGIVGNNGAGKSTFLKIVAGLHRPSGGQVVVRGEVALLTGLGVGMVDELSVTENVFLYGAIHGMERRNIKDRLEDIIQWAELEAFGNAKLKVLSSGMTARLAFSVTRYVEADVVLLDEALTAGDKNFTRRCEEYFETARGQGRTFLVSSHDLDFVEGFCHKALWLDKGRQMAFGDAKAVIRQYRDH